jgi:RNA-binding protein 39
MRTRKSHRSPSRERDRHDRRRERGPDDKRRSSRSHERRDRRSRSRDKSHRDRDRERERDRDRRHRDRDHDRHSHRDRDRDYERDRRRRRREEDGDDAPEDRQKRKRGEDSADESSHPHPRDSPHRSSERALSRDHFSDRRSRHSRDPRDEFDESPKYGRDRGSRRDERRPHNDDDSLRRKPSPPPLAYAFSSPLESPNGLLIELHKYSRRKSPTYEPPPDDPMNDEPREDDSEARSVFVSQLAARLTARDLGYFFEDKLGENTVLDARIVTDRLSRRSKGSVLFTFALTVLTNRTRIGYVEFRTIDNVDKALSLSGTVVMGLPIMVQLTEAERNRLHPGDGYVRYPIGQHSYSHRLCCSNLNLPPGVSAPHGGAMQYVVQDELHTLIQF